MELLGLNKEQQKAFNRLKKAYADCKKLKVNLVNQYGTLYAYNGDLIEDFADDQIKPSGHPVYYTELMEECTHNPNQINKIDVGRADDETEWMVGLTDKGLKLFNKLKDER